MTDRYVLLVDAGYLIASAGQLLHATTNRRELTVDPAGLVTALRQECAQRMTGEMMRTYWYDAARDRVPTTEHRALAVLPGVKVRLGNLNRQGQQKGVDALLRSDLEALSQHRALVRAVLLAGDEDMVPAVEVAQSYGVQIEVWSVEPPFGRNHSERLVWEADTHHELTRDLLAPHVGLVSRHEPVREPADGKRILTGPVGGVEDVAGGEPALTSADDVAGAASARAEQATAEVGAAVDDAFTPGSHAPAAPAEPEPSPPAVPHPTPAMLAGLRRPPSQIVGPDAETVADVGGHIAARWLVQRGRDDLADLLPGPGLPAVLDRELLVAAEEELGRSFRPWPEARKALRDGFFERLWREFGLRV